ncbi:hypothetical protein HMPREF1548_06175 [Clostridium sp. KLE 1755]|nr:hypothetical protein HMPREF1548_06175 [Clostridium sp. KLE 1755]
MPYIFFLFARIHSDYYMLFPLITLQKQKIKKMKFIVDKTDFVMLY